MEAVRCKECGETRWSLFPAPLRRRGTVRAVRRRDAIERGGPARLRPARRAPRAATAGGRDVRRTV